MAAKVLGRFSRIDAKLPIEGLGGLNRPTTAGKEILEGDRAALTIKHTAKHCVERAALDVPAAIDGARPIELIADACGHGWGGVASQMRGDLTSFNAPMIFCGGFADAQQRWPALRAETYAQSMTKSAQKKQKMR